MTLILKQIFGFLKLLNSDKGTNSIAAGIACGFILGMNPISSLHCILLIFVMFFFRIQLGAVFVMAFFFKFIAYLLDPVFHSVGMSVLEMGALQGFFTTLYNLPIIPFTRFNNSIIMGSGVVSFALFPVIFFISKFMVVKYRVLVVERLKQTKIWKAIKATSLFKWYYKYDQFYG